MNKYILIIAMSLFSLTGFAQDKEGTIDKGNSFVDLSFDASDTINESETYWIEISAAQDYTSMQDVYIDIDSILGTMDVYISVYGKLTDASSWTALGDSINWKGTGSDDTTFTMSFTSPTRYRIYKVQFRSGSGNQQSLISDVQFKQWFSGGAVTGATITDGTASLSGGALSGVTTITLENGLTIDNAVNNKLEFNENSDEFIWTFGSNTVTASSGDVTLFDYGTINLGTDALDLSEGDITNGGTASFDQVQADATALVLGAGTETVAINSSDWDIGTTGIITGVGNITSDGDIIATGGDFTGANGNFIDIGEAADGTITLGRDDAGTITLTSLDDDANAALTISAGGTGALTLGDAGSTTAITSSDWAIGATGIATGLGDITSDGKILTTDTIKSAQFVGSGYNFIAAAQLTIPTTDSLVIYNPTIPSLASGLILTFVAEATNTGAVTLTLNGVKKNVYESKDVSELEGGDIYNTGIVTIIYDGTQWQQVSQSGN